MKFFTSIIWMYMYLYVILVYTFVDNNLCFGETLAPFQKQVNGKYVGTPILTQTSRSELRCACMCLKNANETCRYVNFNSLDMTCELFQTAQSTDTGQPGWRRVVVGGGSCEGDWFGFGNMCYLVVKQTASWGISKNNCGVHNGTLAALHTDEIYEHITARLAVEGAWTYWIGGYDNTGDNTGYQWRNGITVDLSSSAWISSEPSDNGERCMALYKYTSGYRFNNRDCTMYHYSLCERDMV